MIGGAGWLDEAKENKNEGQKRPTPLDTYHAVQLELWVFAPVTTSIESPRKERQPQKTTAATTTAMASQRVGDEEVKRPTFDQQTETAKAAVRACWLMVRRSIRPPRTLPMSCSHARCHDMSVRPKRSQDLRSSGFSSQCATAGSSKPSSRGARTTRPSSETRRRWAWRLKATLRTCGKDGDKSSHRYYRIVSRSGTPFTDKTDSATRYASHQTTHAHVFDSELRNKDNGSQSHPATKK